MGAHSFQASTFLCRGAFTEPGTLASIHLKRDLQVPVVLQEKDDQDEGYDEGKVTNTRFGSFPHSTLIGVPWGSQIRASNVDTGSRGRRNQTNGGSQSLKRKRTVDSPQDPASGSTEDLRTKTATDASTGFVHLLPPTPESWTHSLPHRTQVVYTPDYSYILQRLRARPGSVLIEAGAGSGSFTHAAVRSVFNGYPSSSSTSNGKVFSFEFHESRYEALSKELSDHSLDPLVHLTLRDVCEEGFQLPSSSSGSSNPTVQASAIFLDLPAPWLALPHLTRSSSAINYSASPLDPSKAAYICTFSPCIEQVQRTVSSLRAHGWVEIEMVEIAAKRIEVRRERVGLQEEGLRGTNATPATIGESLTKLRELEKRSQIVQAQSSARAALNSDSEITEEMRVRDERLERERAGIVTKQDRLKGIKERMKERKLHLEGRLVHRTEPEIKTHTSYLVFAILPRLWGPVEEEEAQRKVESMEHDRGGKSKRQLKREARQSKFEETSS